MITKENRILELENEVLDLESDLKIYKKQCKDLEANLESLVKEAESKLLTKMSNEVYDALLYLRMLSQLTNGDIKENVMAIAEYLESTLESFGLSFFGDVDSTKDFNMDDHEDLNEQACNNDVVRVICKGMKYNDKILQRAKVEVEDLEEVEEVANTTMTTKENEVYNRLLEENNRLREQVEFQDGIIEDLRKDIKKERGMLTFKTNVFNGQLEGQRAEIIKDLKYDISPELCGLEEIASRLDDRNQSRVQRRLNRINKILGRHFGDF